MLSKKLIGAGGFGGEPFATVGYTTSSGSPRFLRSTSIPLSSLAGGDHPDGRNSVQAGDLIIIFTYSSDFDTSVTPSYTGYTQYFTRYLNAVGDGYNSNYTMHYKIADGTETAFSTPGAFNQNHMAVAGVFSGAAVPIISSSYYVTSSSTTACTYSGTGDFLGLDVEDKTVALSDGYIMYMCGYSNNVAGWNGAGTVDSRLTATLPYEQSVDPSEIVGMFAYSGLETSNNLEFVAPSIPGSIQSPQIGTNFMFAYRILPA